jgi:predicted Rossmann fold nucleotide-binding protein DprA/Smf involved in DNA uptake
MRGDILRMLENELRSVTKALNADAFKAVEGTQLLDDRKKILNAVREKPLKIFEIMKRANISNQEACQSLLLKMREEGLVKFDIHNGQWLAG